MANYLYLTATGTVVPDTSTILAEVTAEYKAVFGTDLVTTPDSPAGLLINAEALARTEVVQNNAAVLNQINPNIAGGVFLDAIMALMGVSRNASSKTYVSGVALTGAPGTVIPVGSIASDSSGNEFALVSTVILGLDGTITGDFRSVVDGPIGCAAHALDTIVSAVLGWETIDNPTPGVIGSNTQSDVSARAYRNNTLGFQGVALPVAIVSALHEVEGVKTLWFQENVAATTESINGISMVAHSIYVAIDGGNTIEIAAALLENKSTGANWNGDTTVTLIEPTSNQEYDVKFTVATPVSVSIEITTPNGNSADIKQAILNYMEGIVPGFPLEDQSAWAVGGLLSCFEIAAAIAAQFPQYIITNVEIDLTTGGAGFDTIPLQAAVNEVFFTTESAISVSVS